MKYLSGWEALNIPNKIKQIADWHPYRLLKEPNKLRFFNLKKDYPLGKLGLEKRYVATLKKEYIVASFARAIADLVYYDETKGLKNCVKDFLDENEEKELFTYLKIINKSKNVENFMIYELTKLYFEDKENYA